MVLYPRSSSSSDLAIVIPFVFPTALNFNCPVFVTSHLLISGPIPCPLGLLASWFQAAEPCSYVVYFTCPIKVLFVSRNINHIMCALFCCTASSDTCFSFPRDGPGLQSFSCGSGISFLSQRQACLCLVLAVPSRKLGDSLSWTHQPQKGEGNIRLRELGCCLQLLALYFFSLCWIPDMLSWVEMEAVHVPAQEFGAMVLHPINNVLCHSWLLRGC